MIIYSPPKNPHEHACRSCSRIEASHNLQMREIARVVLCREQGLNQDKIPWVGFGGFPLILGVFMHF